MNLLRKLAEQALAAFEGEKDATRARAALFVGAYRFLVIGGTVGLGDELEPGEIAALEAARVHLETESLERLADALQAPHGLGAAVARKRLDGGKTLDQAIVKVALAQSQEKNA